MTVFVCLFFLTMVSMIFAFIDASRRTAVNSSAEALCSLWAESVLAEYDLNLQRRYNVFGFYGYPKDVTDKLDYYAEGSFRDKKYIEYGGSSCSLYDYALTDVDLLSEQLVKAGKLAFTEKFIKPDKEVVSVERAGTQDEDGGGDGNSLMICLQRAATRAILSRRSRRHFRSVLSWRRGQSGQRQLLCRTVHLCVF